ncbi:hypothetical protein C0992_005889, partial [Termitomyces sp. T32_za158]
DIPLHIAHKVAQDLQNLHQFLCKEIDTANKAYAKHADAKKKTPPTEPPVPKYSLTGTTYKHGAPS